MFEIIKPKRQSIHQQKIDSFLSLLKVYHNFHLSEEIKTKATFIIAEDTKQGVYGGAILYPIDNTYPEFSSQSQTPLEKISSALQSKREQIWQARICLCIPKEQIISSPELIELSESFYENLYNAFLNFKRKKRIGLLAFTLRFSDLYKKDILKPWAFLYEIKLSTSSDGFFYGILDIPLKKSSSTQETVTVLDFTSEARRAL